MLAFANLANVLGTFDPPWNRRPVASAAATTDVARLEKFEEVALLGKEPLEPGKMGPTLDFLATALNMLVLLAALLNSLGPNERMRSARSARRPQQQRRPV